MPQNHPSRRSVLKGAAGAGVAAAAVATGTITAANAQAAESGAQPDADHTEQVVARVRDARTGEVEIFAGEREIVVRDRQLAASLVKAAR